MNSRIDDLRIFLLITGLIFLISSIVSFLNKKITLAVILLFCFAVTIYLFAAMLDPFLNIWDERFHALVAKNLMNHPLKPTLYDNPVISMVYAPWDRYVIWLHKQPLFLWQISLSLKIFGVNEFAVRVPSVILSSLLVPIAYRSGKLLVNARTGYYTAFFFTTSYFLFELVSGYQGVDHNDVVFLFYVSASIWAWIEYIQSGKRRWLILIGLFSGFAILTKWLVGLLVYSGWGVYILSDKKIRREKKAYIHILVSLAITCLIAIPWQLWVLTQYPMEATRSFKYNSDHFFTVVEGHRGPWWYYITDMSYLYGYLSQVLIFAGVILLFLKIRMERNVKLAILCFTLIIYFFFSIAQTKITSFTFVISLPVFMGMACVVDVIAETILSLKIPRILTKICVFLLLILLFGYNIRFAEIMRNHLPNGTHDRYAGILMKNKKHFLKYKQIFPPKTVIFNVKGRSYLDCMFYTGFPTYNFIPSKEQYLELKNKGGYTIVLVNISKKDCPDYLRNDRSVITLTDCISSFD